MTRKSRKQADEPVAVADPTPAPEPGASLDDLHRAEAAFPVVGIGASAGGLAAFEAFFSAMQHLGDTGMAFVVVQHLSPDHPTLLVDIIRRYTRMEVFEAEHGIAIRPNCTYVIPPNQDLAIDDGVLYLSEHADAKKPRLTVDHFLRSLALSHRERAICLILSGTGNDGTLGLREIKGEGGLVIVQAPETAQYDGMPRSAIATGMVDLVLAPGDMPTHLVNYVNHAFDGTRKSPRGSARDGLISKLCLLLRSQTGHDFSQYKETTLLRRVERRMALQQIAQPEEYLRHARGNPGEVEALFRDLLIGVTNFFRDPAAFRVLEQQALPAVLEGKAAHDEIRVWVCGCSTGEEAYSIAILFYEQALASRKQLRIQVFATDIDRQAIEQARAGIYPASIAANVSEDRLARFFTYDAQHGTYRIQKHIRDLLVFSEQDVIKDPPFSRLDLVSCRNLLIYLKMELQRNLIPLFHYALAPGGVLFLGTSETVGESARLFDVLDRKSKLFRRLSGEHGPVRSTLPEFMPQLYVPGDPHGRRAPMRPLDESANLRQVTERALLGHYAHAALLINTRGEILHIYGRTGKFLEASDGDAKMNVLSMAREGLRRELTIALHKSVAHREPVVYPNLRIKPNGDFIRATVAVRPVESEGSADLYLVVLEEVPGQVAVTGPAAIELDQVGRIEELERDLRAKDEYLQTTLEEMETTNEELKSTNEEMQSINEELQSTNEELETSKEELQSINEELSTVNAELQEKVNDVSRANNDMNNLLAGTGVGTVFVDHQLRIARFTPAATPVVNLIDGDVGRPLDHVATNIVGHHPMMDDIRAVLETLTPREAEVQVKSGAWYLMRIRPYRTTENTIEGAVVTLVDISIRKLAEESLRSSEARLNGFINQAHAGVVETDLEGAFLFVNDWLCNTLGYSRDQLIRKRLSDLTEPQDWPRLREKLDTLASGGSDARLDVHYVRSDGVRVPVHTRLSAIRGRDGKATSLLMLCLDRRPDDRGVSQHVGVVR